MKSKSKSKSKKRSVSKFSDDDEEAEERAMSNNATSRVVMSTKVGPALGRSKDFQTKAKTESNVKRDSSEIREIKFDPKSLKKVGTGKLATSPLNS